MFLVTSTPTLSIRQAIASQRQAILSLRTAIAGLEQCQLDADWATPHDNKSAHSSPVYTLLLEQLMHIASPEARAARLELQLRQARRSLAIAEAKLAELEADHALSQC